MSSLEAKLQKWKAALVQPDITECLEEIKCFLNRSSKQTALHALHIFSKVVLPTFCSAVSLAANEDAIVEMITYLWSFSEQDHFKHFLNKTYESIHGMKATATSCERIKRLTPILAYQRRDENDYSNTYKEINCIVFYIFFMAKHKLGSDLTRALFQNAESIFEQRRAQGVVPFLEAFASLFDKNTQILMLMLSLDKDRTKSFLEIVATLFERHKNDGECTTDTFTNQFWKYCDTLTVYEVKFKVTGLLSTIIGGVKVGGIFHDEQPFAAYLSLIDRILAFKQQSLDDKSFIELTKGFDDFLSNVGVQISAQAITLAVVQLREKLSKSGPIIGEQPCFQFITVIQRFVVWLERNWTSTVPTTGCRSICAPCGPDKDHVLLLLASPVVIEPILSIFNNQTITGRLMEPFLAILRIVVTIIDQLKCETTTRLQGYWLQMFFYLAKTYKPAQHKLSAQYLEIIELIGQKRHAYGAAYPISDSNLLQLYGLVCNANACAGLPADDPFRWHTIDLLCTQAVVEAPKYALRCIFDVMELQKQSYAPMNLHQLLQRPTLRDFGVANVRDRLDRFDLIDLQMKVIFKHRVEDQGTLGDLFEYVWCDKSAEACRLVKLIQYFDETQLNNLPSGRLDRLKQILATAPKPATAEEAFHVAHNLGNINYHLYQAECKAMKKNCRTETITDAAILKRELLPFIDKFNMQHECQLLRLLDEALAHYTAMTRMLVGNVGLIELIGSPTKLLRQLDNLASFYQLRYVEDRAVQAKCLVYVLAQQREHLSAQLSSLALFVEHPRVYEATVATVFDFKMPRTVRALLDANKALTDAICQQQADLMKTTYFAEVAMKLAVYYAATGNCERAERLVVYVADTIRRSESATDTKAKQLVSLMKIHFYHAVFVMRFKHRMLWFKSLHAALPFVLGLLKDVVDVQCSDYLTQPTVFMMKIVPEILEFGAVQKTVGDTDEAYLFMLIKFAMRNGMGLRSGQLLTVLSGLSLDRERLEECETILAYIDKVLMFYSNANLTEKSNYIVTELAVPITPPVVTSPLINEVFTPIEPIRRDSGAPNNCDFVSPISIGNKQQPFRQMLADQKPQRRLSKYIIDHPNGCDCGFCRYPQFRLVSFQTGCLYTRLLQLTVGANEISEMLYTKYYKCWSTIRERFQTQRIASAALAESFNRFAAQFMVQFGQALVQVERMDEAKAKIELADRIFRQEVQARCGAFEQEVACQSANVTFMMEMRQMGEKSPAFVAQSFEKYLSRTRQLKTPARLVVSRPVSKSTTKKIAPRQSFNFLIATEMSAASGLLKADDIFQDSSCVPSRYKKPTLLKTPLAVPPKTPSTAKTPAVSTRKKVAVSTKSPMTIPKLKNSRTKADTVKKLQFVDDQKSSSSSSDDLNAKTPKTVQKPLEEKVKVPKSKMASALEQKRVALEARKHPLHEQNTPPKTPVTIVILSDDEVVDTTPENAAKTERRYDSKSTARRTARKAVKEKIAPIPIIDLLDDVKENDKEAPARKTRATRAIKVVDTPKRSVATRSRK